jgi:tetratricopeptide (TPR) repeat protein
VTGFSLRSLGRGLALAAVLALPPPGAAVAEEEPEGGALEEERGGDASPGEAAKKVPRPKHAVRPRTGKVFEEAREHLGADRYDEAEVVLDKLRLGRLNPLERAHAYRLNGYVAYGRGDLANAIEHLERAVDEEGLPPSERADVLFQIAQIHGLERRWKDVIATLEAWFQVVERPNSLGYYLLALAHYQLEDLDRALLPAKKAVEIAKAPQQAWFQLLLAIHLTRKDYAGATPVAVELVERYPNVGVAQWLQLSALYAATGDDERALGVLELAYRKGLLREDRDLRRLLQVTLSRGIPHRTAQILEQELAEKRVREDADAYELLSMSWVLAREVAKAEGPLARAAELAEKGDLYVRLAQVHLMQEEWEEAAAALREALAKGGLDDPGSAQLLLGVAYYNENKLNEARSWFARAHQSSETRKQAETWLDQIDREIAARRSEAETSG